MNIKEKYLDFVDEYSTTTQIDPRLLKETDVEWFILSLIIDIKEYIRDIKYRGHDPQQNCQCETCQLCNELLNKIQ